MKVNFTAEMRKYIAFAEMPAVKKVMEYAKEDAYSAKDWAKVATRIVFDR